MYHSNGHSSSSEDSSDEEHDGAHADYLDDPDGLDGPNETVFLVYLCVCYLGERRGLMYAASYSPWRNLRGKLYTS